MRIRLLPTLLLLPFCVLGQKDLATGPRQSAAIYAYRLTDVQAQRLFLSDLDGWEKIPLPPPADSFPAGQEDDVKLAPGNYLFIRTIEAQLQVSLRTIGTLRYDLLTSGNTASLVLHTGEGVPVTDAEVAVRRHVISFDAPAACYPLGRWSHARPVWVRYRGASYFFTVGYRGNRYFSLAAKWRRFRQAYWSRLWHPSRYQRYRSSPAARFEHQFRSFFVLSKPKYKPGDTVSGKAFIMDRRGRPVGRELALWLNGESSSEDTLLTKIHPYRPGGYTFSFVLTDSLKLMLDTHYELLLTIPSPARHNDDDEDDDDESKRKVLSRSAFDYEEYDLRSVRLEARVDREEQWPGEPLSLYLQALDENDLPVPDGRIELTVRSGGVQEFHDQAVFIKDTLWQWRQPLDPVGETRIILPDSIFPHASMQYNISCRLLTSDNETDGKDFSVAYVDNPQRVFFTEHDDSLQIAYQRRGQTEKVNATVTAIGPNDEILTQAPMSLPVTLRINPMAGSYFVKVAGQTDSLTADHSIDAAGVDLPIHAGRTPDSVNIVVDDSLSIPFWYTIRMGNRLIRRGYGRGLDFREKARGTEPYFFRLQYLWKGVLREQHTTLYYHEKQLHVVVRQPRFIAPGEQVNVTVTITDAKNHPVPDADLTAFGWTSKFTDARLPTVPDFGRIFRYKAPGNYSIAGSEGKKQRSLPIDWNRWGGLFGLDSLEFYKFLHPATIYVHKELAPDRVTQIAPFVSRKGQPEAVHLLYLDERLIFSDQAEQQRYYSFPTAPGWHTLRLRVTDRELRIDSFLLTLGMKTIIGINDDTTNPAIHVRRMPDTLLPAETALFRNSLITLQNTFSPHFATIRQGDDRLYLLGADAGTSQQAFLMGPFSGAGARLEVKDGFSQPFEPEGGYQFIIQPGLIKEKQWSWYYPYGKRLSNTTSVSGLGDRALTTRIADSLWQDWLDERSATRDLFENVPNYARTKGVLQIGVPTTVQGERIFVKKLFVFRPGDADYLHIFKGMTRQPGAFEPGVYRILLLLKGDSYMVYDSAVIRANGISYYGFDSIPVTPADGFSRSLAAKLRQLEDNWNDAHSPGTDSLHFLFNDRYIGNGDYYQAATGVVADKDGRPLQGATVQVKGTRQSTVTDEKGRFHLRIPNRGTLVFAYIGYNVEERPFTQPEDYTIRMQPATHALNEVVVIGYGISRKRELTGSVSVLEGKVAGIDINQDLGRESDDALQQLLSRSPLLPGDTAHILRRRFRDDAFWQPRLRTDANGQARFTFAYSDDITRWNTYFIAAAGHGQTGFSAAAVRSAKPLSARLSNPAFLVAGDSAFVIGKLLNYGPDTVTVSRRFIIGDAAIAESRVSLRNTRIDTFLVHPAAGLGRGERSDSVRLTYSLQRSDGYFDGEERSIPVFPAGTTETRGHFAVLEGDTSLPLHFDSALGPVHVYASASLLPVLLDEIESLRQYEYLCNEQLASKLLALLQKQRIFKITQQEFNEDKNIREIIGRLMKTRRGNALWGWWAEGGEVAWISLHVAEALLSAEKAGYSTGLDKQMLIDYLVYNYESGIAFDRLLYLRLLQELGARVDYRRYTDTALRYLDRHSLYQTLRLVDIRQAAGLPTGLDTLAGKRQYTALGNCYWGEDGRSFFDNSVPITVLMYRLLRQAGGYESILHKTRNWLLEKRGTGHWRNTYESSLILETLLPDLLTNGGPSKPPALTLNGGPITNFPFERTYPVASGLAVAKSGKLPVYFTAWQRFFNPSPERIEGTFTVNTHFEQDDQPEQRLQSGKPVTLVAEVTASGDADYVLIEIPVPAGCTYAEKTQFFGYQVVHAEYFKNKLSLFCQSLAKGKHVFRILLMPRWTGIYRINPARAEMMYYPVLFGREGMKRAIIE